MSDKRHGHDKFVYDAKDSALSDADEKVLRGKEDRQHVQKKTFTKWVNSHLSKVGHKVEELYVDLRDGVNLLKLLEVISGDSQPKADKGRGRFVMSGNVNKALKYISSKVQLTNIGAEDIIDGNPVLTLGLIWTIILRFQIQDISVDELSAKDALLLWVKKKTKGYKGVNVENFHRSFNDGLAFAALIHAHRPDLIDYNNLDPQKPLDNLTLAFDVAEKRLGIASLLDPIDVAVEKPDERSIMTYVAALYHYFANQQKEDVAGRRVASSIGELADIAQLQNEYERLATDLMKWIVATIYKLDDRELPNTIDGVQKHQVDFKAYRSVEKPPHFKEKDELEAKFFEIQTKLRALNRPMYQPPEGRLVSDINKAWSVLENAEHDREVALIEELKRLTRLEQMAQRFSKKATIQEQWLNNTEKAVETTENSKDLLSLQSAIKKIDSIIADIVAHEDRIASVNVMARQLEAESYREKDQVLARRDDIERRWFTLNDSVKQKRLDLEDALALLTFERDSNSVLDFIKAKESLALSTDYGKDLITAEDLLRAHKDFTIELVAVADRVAIVDEEAAALIESRNKEADAIRRKQKEVDDGFAKLNEAAKKRQQSLENAVRAHKVWENLATEEQWIKDRELSVNSKDYGTDQSSTQRLVKTHAVVQSAIALHEEVIIEVLKEAEAIESY